MPTRDGYPEGVPCWVDLATTDVESALGFYTEVFGWHFDAPDDEGIPYWMAYQKDLPAAGVGPAPEGQNSMWTTYFAVDDADAATARIRDGDGQVVMEPTDVLDAGRLAVAIDPGGAVFGIWESGQHNGARIVNEHGALNWNELKTPDIDAAADFYAGVFGCEQRTQNEEGGRYILLAVGGREVAGVTTPADAAQANTWRVYFAVDDARMTRDRATSAGGTAITEPIEVPDVGTFVVIADPTGAVFTVVQLAMEID